MNPEIHMVTFLDPAKNPKNHAMHWPWRVTDYRDFGLCPDPSTLANPHLSPLCNKHRPGRAVRAGIPWNQG